MKSLIPVQNTQKPDFGFSRDKQGRRPATSNFRWRLGWSKKSRRAILSSPGYLCVAGWSPRNRDFGLFGFFDRKGVQIGSRGYGSLERFPAFSGLKTASNVFKPTQNPFGKNSKFSKKIYFSRFSEGFCLYLPSSISGKRPEIPLFSGQNFAILAEKAQKRAFWPNSTRFFESVCQNDLNRRRKLSKGPI